MLKLLNPQKDGFTGAVLDETGNAIKIDCDVLEVTAYVIDVDMQPMPTLIATYGRFDSKQDYFRAGPMSQHYISGQELSDMLVAEPNGITIAAIDHSTAKTGIPSAHIYPSDLEYFEPPKPWHDRYIKKIAKFLEQLKQQAQQAGMGTMAGPIIPPPGPTL